MYGIQFESLIFFTFLPTSIRIQTKEKLKGNFPDFIGTENYFTEVCTPIQMLVSLYSNY